MELVCQVAIAPSGAQKQKAGGYPAFRPSKLGYFAL